MKQENCPVLLQHKKNKMVVCFKTPISGFVLYPGDTDFSICAHLDKLDYKEFRLFKELLTLNNYSYKISTNTNIISEIEFLPVAYNDSYSENKEYEF